MNQKVIKNANQNKVFLNNISVMKINKNVNIQCQ